MKFIQETEKLRTAIVIVQTNYIALFEKLLSLSEYIVWWIE
jgi:hypothetical protein